MAIENFEILKNNLLVKIVRALKASWACIVRFQRNLGWGIASFMTTMTMRIMIRKWGRFFLAWIVKTENTSQNACITLNVLTFYTQLSMPPEYIHNRYEIFISVYHIERHTLIILPKSPTKDSLLPTIAGNARCQSEFQVKYMSKPDLIMDIFNGISSPSDSPQKKAKGSNSNLI